MSPEQQTPSAPEFKLDNVISERDIQEAYAERTIKDLERQLKTATSDLKAERDHSSDWRARYTACELAGIAAITENMSYAAQVAPKIENRDAMTRTLSIYEEERKIMKETVASLKEQRESTREHKGLSRKALEKEKQDDTKPRQEVRSWQAALKEDSERRGEERRIQNQQLDSKVQLIDPVSESLRISTNQSQRDGEEVSIWRQMCEDLQVEFAEMEAKVWRRQEEYEAGRLED